VQEAIDYFMSDLGWHRFGLAGIIENVPNLQRGVTAAAHGWGDLVSALPRLIYSCHNGDLLLALQFGVQGDWREIGLGLISPNEQAS
jgi:hypothetical protein